MKVIIFEESNLQDWSPEVLAVYPQGLGAELSSILAEHQVEVVDVFMEDCGLSPEKLAETDLLIWWGHCHHDKVSDKVNQWVVDAVHGGMGFIALHSAHFAKPFKTLMGTSCRLRWRDDEGERVWITAPAHPIAKGLPEYFEIKQEEMYGEHFDIPHPEDIVAMGWFNGGELFRSVVTYTRGYGKVCYIQFGHETCPVYKNPYVRQIIRNSAEFCRSSYRADLPLPCPHVEALGPVVKA